MKSSLFGAGSAAFLLLAAGTAAGTVKGDGASAAATGGAPIAWQQIAPGAAHAIIGASDGDRPPIQLFRFELSRFRAEVVVGDGKPPRARTAAAIVQKLKAVAAVNGGFFDQKVAPLGLRVAAGVTRSPLRPKADWGVLWFTQSGHARITHTKDFAKDFAAAGTAHAKDGGVDGIRDAIQVGPRLVVDGTPLQLKPQFARRTAVAVDRDGRTLTLIVADTEIDANDLADQLARHGFDSALMLDGGPSTQIAVEIGATKMDLPGLYPVPDLLAIFALPAVPPAVSGPGKTSAPRTPPRP